jgi:hypothetical protein
MGFVHEPVQTTSPIEQRVLGVQMEMNKVRVRHGFKLPPGMRKQQGRDVHKKDHRQRWRQSAIISLQAACTQKNVKEEK